MKNFSLKVIQWNCRSIKNKYNFQYVGGEYDIILLIETWLNELAHFNLIGFDIVRFDRDCNKSGAIAICIEKSIIFEKVDLTFNNQVKKESASAFFLDVKGPYDNVNPEILIDDLIKLGIPKNCRSY